ncbi:trypsin-like peptidase domain-containing protein [Nesterenkonia pannonica]|uniref:trypsin-like peptidase domain-containing protein n=1 Tax=Nesterenkonia pannonica TaxID=1548602 RepID=UPI0021641DFB|nr:trypsin-like peptidase domain-containing protein [Nesterenkonia pannonica]
MDSDIPELAQLLVPETEEAPELTGELTAEAEAASASVAKITGVAEQCAQSQSGSGVAVSETRVVTNAHVVAGVPDPSVELPDGQVVTGLSLSTSTPLRTSHSWPSTPPGPCGNHRRAPGCRRRGLRHGLPLRRPLHRRPAVVQARETSQVNSIYGDDPTSLEIYQISADVRQGNSGGPLVDPEGNVVGVVFARAMEGNQVGFAITAETGGDVLSNPGAFTETVSTGQCTDR